MPHPPPAGLGPPRSSCNDQYVVQGRRSFWWFASVGIAAVLLAGCSAQSSPSHALHTTTTTSSASTSPRESTPTTAGIKPSPHTTRSSSASPRLPPPGPGFVPGHVTAVGDSVMLDYQSALQQDVPGVVVNAGVSRQWSGGLALLQQMKAAGQLGAVVVVALGTNGPITPDDFDAMMSTLSGASRVVFVNVVVGQPWQDQVNRVLAAGVAHHRNAVLADWATLEAHNPGWVYSDGTHLPIDGAGAQALASLIASKI